MPEICQSGSEGGAKIAFVPTPILASELLISGSKGATRRGTELRPIWRHKVFCSDREGDKKSGCRKYSFPYFRQAVWRSIMS